MPFQLLFLHEPKFITFTDSLLTFQSKTLSEDRKAHFEEEIKTLSGALKAQYDQANKEYEGTHKYLTCQNFILFFLNHSDHLFSISDLPASTPLVDLSKMADLDMSELPKVEESGERCRCRIQEFIINELSSDQAAVLSEDKLQHLVVGVSLTTNSYRLEFATF